MALSLSLLSLSSLSLSVCVGGEGGGGYIKLAIIVGYAFCILFVCKFHFTCHFPTDSCKSANIQYDCHGLLVHVLVLQ